MSKSAIPAGLTLVYFCCKNTIEDIASFSLVLSKVELAEAQLSTDGLWHRGRRGKHVLDLAGQVQN